MEWISFFSGALFVTATFAMFKGDKEEADDNIIEETGPDDVPINDFSARHVTMSCQTCRKLKRHKEIETNLYQCVKCKRHVDLRAS